MGTSAVLVLTALFFQQMVPMQGVVATAPAQGQQFLHTAARILETPAPAPEGAPADSDHGIVPDYKDEYGSTETAVKEQMEKISNHPQNFTFGPGVGASPSPA